MKFIRRTIVLILVLSCLTSLCLPISATTATQEVTLTIKNTVSSLYDSCEVGDVVQLMSKASGTPYHSIVISSRTLSTAYYCGHSSNRVNENIVSISDDTNSFVLFDLT